ncbi:MAG: MMPL family transporter [Hyphomicrobiales bacterium]|nr:MMPL family transporter [Hyphomicrobiales bacterium]
MTKSASTPHQTSLSFGLERIGLLPLRYPWTTAIVLAVITIAAVIGMQRLTVDDSLSELFRADTTEFRQYETMAQRFPSSEFDVLIVVEGKTLLKRQTLDKLRDTVIELQFVPSMKGLISLFSARQPPRKGEVPPPLFPADLPQGAAYDRLIDKVLANQIIAGKLLSDDGELALIVVALDRKVVASQGLRQAVGEIRNIAEQGLAGTGLNVQLSGAPVMQLEIRNAVERDQLLYNALGFLLGAIIAIGFFRRVSLMVIATLPPVLGILWSLGLFGFMGFKLNLFLNVMSPLIMVMGFSDTMQITYAIRDRLIAGDSRADAIRWAILVVGPACVLTVATAAASFITLFLSDSALIRTFGLAGALSTLIAYMAVITLVPFLSLLLLRNEKAFSEKLGARDLGMDFLKTFCGHVAESVARRPMLVALAGLIVVAGLGVVHLSLEPRYRLADQVPDREQALAASDRLDTKLTGANPVHVMIDWPAGKSLYDADVLEVIGKVHAIVEDQSGVGNVWSVETLRRWLREADDDSSATLQEYLEILPKHLTNRFINFGEKAAVVTGRIPDVDASQLLPVVRKLERLAAGVQSAHPDFRIAVTGLAAVAARNSGAMISQLNTGLTSEMVFVSAMVGLAFRSLMVGLVTILPALFPVFAAGALLYLSGEGLQFASIVALTISFGLSLDATIHYLNRLRLETRPGEDPSIGVKRATVLVGPALMLTTVVLAFGLGITVFSDLPSLRLFGRLTAVTLVAALVGDLLILPAAMLVARRLALRLRPGR